MALKQIFYDWYEANIWLFYKINGFFAGHELPMQIMTILTEFGNIKKLHYLLAITLVILFTYAYTTKLNQDLTKLKKFIALWKTQLLIVITASVLTAMIGYTLKKYFAYLRPICFLSNVHYAIEITASSKEEFLLKRCTDDGSFPSTHAAFAAIIMASLWKVSCNFSRFFLLTYCILIGISRIVIGLHFPADIIGGYLMGILTVLGARKLLQHHAFSFLR